MTFPRVLGIEAAGTVAACPGGEYTVGQQVAALMGGMGRTFDGGCAEYTCVPVRQVVPFTSSLDWATLGAVPEMLQTSIHRTYRLDEIAEAHADMEAGRATGKLVVVP